MDPEPPVARGVGGRPRPVVPAGGRGGRPGPRHPPTRPARHAGPGAGSGGRASTASSTRSGRTTRPTTRRRRSTATSRGCAGTSDPRADGWLARAPATSSSSATTSSTPPWSGSWPPSCPQLPPDRVLESSARGARRSGAGRRSRSSAATRTSTWRRWPSTSCGCGCRTSWCGPASRSATARPWRRPAPRSRPTRCASAASSCSCRPSRGRAVRRRRWPRGRRTAAAWPTRPASTRVRPWAVSSRRSPRASSPRGDRPAGLVGAPDRGPPLRTPGRTPAGPRRGAASARRAPGGHRSPAPAAWARPGSRSRSPPRSPSATRSTPSWWTSPPSRTPPASCRPWPRRSACGSSPRSRRRAVDVAAALADAALLLVLDNAEHVADACRGPGRRRRPARAGGPGAGHLTGHAARPQRVRRPPPAAADASGRPRPRRPRAAAERAGVPRARPAPRPLLRADRGSTPNRSSRSCSTSTGCPLAIELVAGQVADAAPRRRPRPARAGPRPGHGRGRAGRGPAADPAPDHPLVLRPVDLGPAGPAPGRRRLPRRRGPGHRRGARRRGGARPRPGAAAARAGGRVAAGRRPPVAPATGCCSPSGRSCSRRSRRWESWRPTEDRFLRWAVRAADEIGAGLSRPRRGPGRPAAAGRARQPARGPRPGPRRRADGRPGPDHPGVRPALDLARPPRGVVLVPGAGRRAGDRRASPRGRDPGRRGRGGPPGGGLRPGGRAGAAGARGRRGGRARLPRGGAVLVGAGRRRPLPRRLRLRRP